MAESFAHVSEDNSRYHLLEAHLTGVADLASVMAAEFGASGWGLRPGNGMILEHVPRCSRRGSTRSQTPMSILRQSRSRLTIRPREGSGRSRG